MFLGGEALRKAFLGGHEVWSSGGGGLSSYLFRRWTFDGLDDSQAEVPAELFGNARLGGGELRIDGNGSIQTNYARLSGDNWPVDSYEGGATIEFWAYPDEMRNWTRFFEFGQGDGKCEAAYAKYGDGSGMNFELQGAGEHTDSGTRCITP